MEQVTVLKTPASYYVDKRLKKSLDSKIKGELERKDKDFVMCIDGKEGAGKSWFAFQIGKYVDPSLNLNRVVFNAEQFREAIFKAKKGQCIVYDEAITGLSSRASLSGVNRVLISLMMQMRQKNLFVIIVLPTFFLLDKYVALFRARVLIHVYECKGHRGYFKVYNSRLKTRLFLLGKHTYSYVAKKVRTNFRGRFYGVFALGDEKVEDTYRKNKEKALMESEKNPMSAGQVKYREQRDVTLFVLRKSTKLTYREIQNLLMDYDIDLSYRQIRDICFKYGAKDDEEAKKIDKKDKDNDNTPKIKLNVNNKPKDEDFESNPFGFSPVSPGDHMEN
jgi:hypothetical protein